MTDRSIDLPYHRKHVRISLPTAYIQLYGVEGDDDLADAGALLGKDVSTCDLIEGEAGAYNRPDTITLDKCHHSIDVA